jgi:hypothetical protein
MGYSGAGGKLINEKTRSKKSRDTVPLTIYCCWPEFQACTRLYVVANCIHTAELSMHENQTQFPTAFLHQNGVCTRMRLCSQPTPEWSMHENETLFPAAFIQQNGVCMRTRLWAVPNCINTAEGSTVCMSSRLRSQLHAYIRMQYARTQLRLFPTAFTHQNAIYKDHTQDYS